MKSVPNGYWKEWSNVEGALHRIMEENRGLIPGRSYFNENKLSGLLVSIQNYHGGLNEVRRRLGISDKKCCSDCKQILSKSQFRKRHKRHKDGSIDEFLSNTCKTCDNASIDEYRHTHTGIAREIMRKVRYRASKMGREFTLTEQWILRRLDEIEWKCELTGLPFDFYAPGAGNTNHFALSLDRIDPSGGYTPDNVQFVINWANRAKSNLSVEEFKRLCKAVADSI